MLGLDGTDNKKNLGANAILGVSMAVARAAAQSARTPLYAYLGGAGARRLPVPCMNILNGGEHADNSVDFQEFMVVSLGAASFAEGLRSVAETFHALKGILKKEGFATSVGDEGGFAPNLPSNEAAVEYILRGIEAAGYRPGEDIAIAIDNAANSFCPTLKDDYDLKWSGRGAMTSSDLIALAGEWLAKYPIVLWEDPLAEQGWDGFAQFIATHGDKIEVVGDDIFVTNPKYITQGIERKQPMRALLN